MASNDKAPGDGGDYQRGTGDTPPSTAREEARCRLGEERVTKDAHGSEERSDEIKKRGKYPEGEIVWG